MIIDIVYIFTGGHQETHRHRRLLYHPRVGEYIEFEDLGVWRIDRVHWQADHGRLLVHLAPDDTNYALHVRAHDG